MPESLYFTSEGLTYIKNTNYHPIGAPTLGGSRPQLAQSDIQNRPELHSTGSCEGLHQSTTSRNQYKGLKTLISHTLSGEEDPVQLTTRDLEQNQEKLLIRGTAAWEMWDKIIQTPVLVLKIHKFVFYSNYPSFSSYKFSHFEQWWLFWASC